MANIRSAGCRQDHETAVYIHRPEGGGHCYALPMVFLQAVTTLYEQCVREPAKGSC